LALCVGDRVDGRAHLEAGDATAARRWLERANRNFALMGGEEGTST
jgi:hypothetical protein